MTVFKNQPGTRTVEIAAGMYDVVNIELTGFSSGYLFLLGDVQASQIVLNKASKITSIEFEGRRLFGTSGDDKFDFTGITYTEYLSSAIELGDGNDTFLAGSGGVWVDGGSGNDILYGGGIDQLLGGDGDDIIHGGTGRNELSGGSGKDIFVAQKRTPIADNDSENTITDFAVGTDRIDVSGYGIASFRQLQHILESTGAQTYFEARLGLSLNSFTLKGVVKGKLTASDFIFFTGSASTIEGTNEDDRLFAGSKGSVLKGGFGYNELFGGDASDVFVVRARANGNTGQNAIFDFVSGADRIDVSAYGISSFDQLKRILKVEANGDISFSPEADIYPLSNVTIKGGSSIKLSSRDFILYTGEKKQVVGNNWDDRLFAAASGSTLKGGDGFDSLYGGDGNDILDGGEFTDIAYGGKGDDIYIFESSNDSAVENKNEGVDLVKAYWDRTTLSANIENLTLLGYAKYGIGNDLANVIRANPKGSLLQGMKGNDALIGGIANDTLDGGVGADTMSGGKEDDTYIVDNAKDEVIEKSGQGVDQVQSSVSYALTTHVEDLELTGDDNLNGTGNNLENVISGNDGNNKIKGGAGDDTIYGGGGSDVLDGGTGYDNIEGGTGNDTYIVNDRYDLIVEWKGEGIDHVKSSIDFVLGDNTENITLTTGNVSGTGNSLANVMVGSSGDNTLKGLAGNDTLIGSAGADSLYGGKGKDYFVFTALKDSKTSASLRDTIFDFSRKEGDRIDLSGIDSKEASSKNDAFAFVGEAKFSKKAGELRFEKKADYTVVYGDVNGDGKADFAIEINGLISMSKGDFVL